MNGMRILRDSTGMPDLLEGWVSFDHRSTALQKGARRQRGRNRVLRRALGLISWAALASMIFACLSWQPALAQTTQAITGLVTDSTGAVIPKASVKVRNEG